MIFLFATVGIFAVVFGSVPGQFFEATYEPSLGVDKEVAERFDLINVTLYKNSGSDNMTYTYSSWWDNGGEWADGLPDGQYLEVWWGYEPYITKVLEFRHVKDWFGGIILVDRLEFETEDNIAKGAYLFKSTLVDYYDSEKNGTVFYAECSHLDVSTIISFNQSKYSDIGTAWDNNELNYMLSYEIDWNATGLSAFTVLGQLLTFQNPDLGISGDFGIILNAFIAFPFWAMTAILIIKLIQSVIPFLTGIDE